ncbi:MAG: GtrA family protein [Verrucomicrobiota bacterium]|jgi:putative flippase GtrA
MRTFLTALYFSNRRLVLYCAIGLCGASLDFLIYSGLVMWDVVHYQIANAIGYASGTAFTFTLNALFNFKTRDWLPLRFLSFCGVAFLGWTTSAATLYIVIDCFAWNKYLAKLAPIITVVLVQYNLNRLISFRKSRAIPTD